MKRYKRLTDKNIKNFCLYSKVNENCYIYNRLFELEDKIESNKFVELRCNVGDSVYCVSQQNEKVYKYKIQEIIIMKNGICYELESKYNGELNFFFESDFDKYWFTDKNKAELRLKTLIKEKKNEKEHEHSNDTKKHCNTKRNRRKNK